MAGAPDGPYDAGGVRRLMILFHVLPKELDMAISRTNCEASRLHWLQHTLAPPPRARVFALGLSWVRVSATMQWEISMGPTLLGYDGGLPCCPLLFVILLFITSYSIAASLVDPSTSIHATSHEHVRQQYSQTNNGGIRITTKDPAWRKLSG